MNQQVILKTEDLWWDNQTITLSQRYLHLKEKLAIIRGKWKGGERRSSSHAPRQDMERGYAEIQFCSDRGFRRHHLTSTSADVTFTDPAPLLFPSQTRKYRPRTFWYPYFWLWWPVGSEQLEQTEVGRVNITSHTRSQQPRRSWRETNHQIWENCFPTLALYSADFCHKIMS